MASTLQGSAHWGCGRVAPRTKQRCQAKDVAFLDATNDEAGLVRIGG